MARRALLALTVLALVVGAGCLSTITGDIGEVNGYRYDSNLDVTVADGLNASEQEAVASRAMARIERIRGLEFRQTTPVVVISRAEYRNRSGSGGDPTNLSDRQLWNEQVWEGLFIIGEDTTYPQTRTTNRGASVIGYYSSKNEQITLVSDSATPTVSRDTLVHELVHALQDQQLNLGGDPKFQDVQLAQKGVTEGEANYIEALYRQRCVNGQWSCISQPSRNGSGRPAEFNQALFLTTFAPYAEGPYFVDAIRSRGGWDAVDDLYGNYPASTEQVIHPETYPDEEPRTVSLRDRSDGDWRRFTGLDRPVYDTVGEASIYAMFQGNGVIGREGSDQYDYDHRFSAGWDGDRLVPYRNGDRYGYVWRTAWDSKDDAREFADAYRDLLDSKDAESLGDGRYRIPEGSYADAFRVARSGSTVTVVNAPTVDDLDAIHAAT